VSEVATQPAPTVPATTGSDQSAAGTPGPAITPEGFVPLSEVEQIREEARRSRQAAEDLRQELARSKAAAPKPADNDANQGFDPEEFRRGLLRDVSGVLSLTQASAAARTEFPNADPALFEPERISQFSSPEAYRLAVEDSHTRVAAILDAGWAAREEKLRAELATKFGDAGASAGGTAPLTSGDPTIAQVLAMSIDEMNELEARSPGTLNRVKRTAGMA